MRERLYALDFLRAAMMFLGVFLHGFFLNPQADALSPGWNARVVNFVSEVIHTFRMPFFFALSGFFGALLLQKLGLRNFVLNRLKRIVFPFILSVVTIGLVTNFLYHVLTLTHRGYDLESAFETAVTLRYFKATDFEPIHLWFLYYLVTFIPAALLLHWCVKQSSIKQRVLAFFGNRAWTQRFFPAAVLLSVLPAAFLLVTANNGNPTPRSYQFSFVNFFPYFYYFVCGWVAFRTQLVLARFAPQYKLHLALAVVFTLIRQVLWSASLKENFFLITLLYSLSVWFYIFGLLGFAVRHCHRPSPFVRYFSDASYWVYLVHLPLIVLLRLYVRDSVSLLPFCLLLGFVLTACVVTYNYLVRPTVIGVLLNGKAYEPLAFHRLYAPKTVFSAPRKPTKLTRTRKHYVEPEY